MLKLKGGMRRSVVIAHLCVPAALTLCVFFFGVLRREQFGLETFAAYVFGGYFFYAAPHLLWTVIAVLAKFSIAVLHAGYFASSIALGAIAPMWLFPQDPSGLPLQWMLYWPLAIGLQILMAGLTAIYMRTRAPISSLEPKLK